MHLWQILIPALLAPAVLSQHTVQQYPLSSQNLFKEHHPKQTYSLDIDPIDPEYSSNYRLSSLSAHEFTTVRHPSFPKYSYRIKKSDFCDGTVNTYTGYIDIEARHLFFYFFESRSNPDKDDVVFWTNGGPGASSSLGLFMELGPCRIDKETNDTTFFDQSWNSNANMFFIDQPIGVGFSYADYGEYVSTSEQAAIDVAAFVAIFFETFSQFKGRGFHMAGESYAGHYLPIFASTVYDQNSKLINAGLTPINLKSLMIGDGMTDIFYMYPSYVDYACTSVAMPPFLDIAHCLQLKRKSPRCLTWFKAFCIDVFDDISCGAAKSFCEATIVSPVFASGINPYDASKMCEGSLKDTVCYPVTKSIEAYLNQPTVRQKLGVDSSVGPFSSISWDVSAAFEQTLDILHPTEDYIAMLLERGIRVLLYVGENDWICNWIGIENWTLAMEWSGKEDFVAQPLEHWRIGNKTIGKFRSSGPLTFLTVEGAGHMVPYDKPVEALEMANTWIQGRKFMT